MALNVGDRVEIAEDRDFGSDHVGKGTRGKVTQIVSLGEEYWVRFDNMNRDVVVPNEILIPSA